MPYAGRTLLRDTAQTVAPCILLVRGRGMIPELDTERRQLRERLRSPQVSVGAGTRAPCTGQRVRAVTPALRLGNPLPVQASAIRPIYENVCRAKVVRKPLLLSVNREFLLLKSR